MASCVLKANRWKEVDSASFLVAYPISLEMKKLLNFIKTVLPKSLMQSTPINPKKATIPLHNIQIARALQVRLKLEKAEG